MQTVALRHKSVSSAVENETSPGEHLLGPGHQVTMQLELSIHQVTSLGRPRNPCSGGSGTSRIKLEQDQRAQVD